MTIRLPKLLTRIDLYWWAGTEERYWRYLCGLIAKACAQDFRVLVLSVEPTHAKRLDQLLWSWPAGQMVPHHYLHVSEPTVKELSLEAHQYSVPVLIIDAFVRCTPPDAQNCLLINTFDQPYHPSHNIGRIAELLSQASCDEPGTRAKLDYYQSCGESCHTHHLK